MVSEPDEDELEELIEQAMKESPSKWPAEYPVQGTKASIKLEQSNIAHVRENTETLKELNQTNQELAATIEEHKQSS